MEAFYESTRDIDLQSVIYDSFHDLTYPPHLHSSFELLFMQEGYMTIYINGQNEEMRPGDVAIVPPGDIHSFKTPISSRGRLVFFDSEYCGDIGQMFTKYTLLRHVARFPERKFDEIFERFDRSLKNPCAVLLFKGFLNTLFFDAIESLKLVEKKHDVSRAVLKKILTFIRDRYDSGINLNDAAKELGLSRSYVSRFFKKAIGYGFNDYVNRLRVEKAKSLLISGKLDIMDAGMECGFENLRSFDRIFKKHTNMTPSEYRRQSESVETSKID